ncbi:MAG TPA: amino acid permease [Steroidobacteraceae bacterium]|nr:amino acid permease [Steroidobacteraceae bacterium]
MTRGPGLGLLRRKSVALCVAESLGERGPHLERALGFWSLTAFGVGCTVGAGIFSLTGDVAAHQAGPAVSLAFVLASLACFFAGLCYAEFAAMVPISGSAYSYSYVTLGELTAWIVGWSLVLEWLFSAALVAISWSGYAQATLRDLGLALPPLLTQAPLALDARHHLLATGAWLDLPAVLVVLACTALLLAGTRTSAAVNTVIVLAKVSALIVLVAVGARYVQPANWRPFIPPNAGGFGQFGWSGVARGAGILFFAYLGFDGVSTLAEEARNPQRTLPWSLFASLLICTALYVSVSLVITGLADFRSLAVADPLYYALSAARGPLGPVRALVSLVALVGLVSVVLACIVGQVRIFYSMARDGLLPPAFARMSGAHRTPVIGTLLTGAVAALIAGLIPLAALGELISLGTLLAFTMVCVGIPMLRRIDPGAHRPFRTPWVPVVPALGIVSCVALMVSLPGGTWLQLCAWGALGLIIYAAYGRRHSRLRDGASAGGSGARA